jgi:ABC-type nitrate/sulfonate/bicarbonate transport system permease component
MKPIDPRGFVLPVLAIIAGEAGMRLSGNQSNSLAAPSDIALSFASGMADGSILYASLQTLLTALGGFVMGGLIGFALGVAFGLFEKLDRLFEFPIEVLRPIPSIAVLPLALLFFGFGYRMGLVVVAFSCTWPIMLFTRAAVQSVEPRLVEVAKVLRLSSSAFLFKILLPASLPRLFVAARLSAGIALIVAVTVEIAVNPQGLGFAMIDAQQSLRPDRMFALLLWIGVLGWGLNALFHWLEGILFNPGFTPVTME